jgi:hypothetical protein
MLKRKHSFHLLGLVLISAPIFRVKADIPHLQNGPNCSVALDSLDLLYASNQLDFLSWNFDSLDCNASQKYQGWAKQGLTFIDVSEWSEAIYALNRAKEIGGNEDEKILYGLWEAYKNLGQASAISILIDEFKKRFPHSLYLQRIGNELRQASHTLPIQKPWRGYLKNQFSRNSLNSLDMLASNQIKGSLDQTHSNHTFEEFASVTLKSKIGESVIHRFDLNIGGEWRFGLLGLEVEAGAGYESPTHQDTTLKVMYDASNSESFTQFANWNAYKAQIEINYLFPVRKDFWLNAGMGLRLLDKDWWAFDLTFYAPYRWKLGSLSILGNVQKHALNWSYSEFDSLASGEKIQTQFTLDQMLVGQGEVTPGYLLGNHEWLLGFGYFLLRTGSFYSQEYTGITEVNAEEYSYEHTLTWSPTYRYTWPYSWCQGLRSKIGFTYGLAFKSVDGKNTYTQKKTYSADIGFSLSF